MDTPNTTPSQAIPPLRLGTLLTVFRDSYASHLLIPSLLVFLLVKLASSSEVAVVGVFLLASALLVSAAHRALTDGNIFAELSFRRAFFRALVIVSLVGLAVCFTFLAAPVFFFFFLTSGAEVAPFMDFDLKEAGGSFVLAAISLTGLYLFVRLWPVYVVQYIFRDSPADVWKDTWHMKFPDAGLAWRLTGVPGAFWCANVPVFLGAVGTGLLAVGLYEGRRLGWPVIDYGCTVGFYFGVLPFIHLLLVERAMQLAGVSEKVFAQAMGIAEAGTLWFANRFDPVPESESTQESQMPEPEADMQNWVGTYRDPDTQVRLQSLLGLADRHAVIEIEAALIGLYRTFRGLDPATLTSPLALSPEERAALAQACWPVLRKQRPLEYRRINREVREEGRPYEQRFGPRHALYLAAELLQQADPSLSLYDAKKLCLTAYKKCYDASAFNLIAEDRLCWLGEEVAVPNTGSRFKKLLELTDPRYWEHPLYQELYALPADDLPDGAMLAVLPLAYVNVHSRAFDMEDILPVMDLFKRYGQRLYPAVVEYLQNPHKYPPKDPHLVFNQDLFELIATWPQQYAEPLFRSAFASGWNEAAKVLPQTDWAETLIREFADSPYDPPRLPERRSFSPIPPVAQTG